MRRNLLTLLLGVTMSDFISDEDGFIPDFSEVVAEFNDLTSADVAAALLENESVRAIVGPFRSISGAPAPFQVLVDSRQLHRARWVLRESDLTDAELTYLATGELGRESD